jgi:hypothetical protein
MTRPRSTPPLSTMRWPWFDQARDALAILAGLVLLGLESYRGTYNPVAMGIVAFFWTGAATGVYVRKVFGGEEERK